MYSGTTVTEYKKFELNLDYRVTNRVPTYIVIVCSASKYGDYFVGGRGSTLYVDEFRPRPGASFPERALQLQHLRQGRPPPSVRSRAAGGVAPGTMASSIGLEIDVLNESKPGVYQHGKMACRWSAPGIPAPWPWRCAPTKTPTASTPARPPAALAGIVYVQERHPA